MDSDGLRHGAVPGKMGVGRVAGVGAEGCSAKPFSPPLFSLCQSPSRGPEWEHITPPGGLLLRAVSSKESPGVKMLQNLRPAMPEGREEGAALQDGALAIPGNC